MLESDPSTTDGSTPGAAWQLNTTHQQSGTQTWSYSRPPSSYRQDRGNRNGGFRNPYRVPPRNPPHRPPRDNQRNPTWTNHEDNLSVKALIDTGASVSLVRADQLSDTWAGHIRPAARPTSLRTVTGAGMVVLGTVTLPLGYTYVDVGHDSRAPPAVRASPCSLDTEAICAAIEAAVALRPTDIESVLPIDPDITERDLQALRDLLTEAADIFAW
ncbi:unnamed protein product [Dibothriocephalus latus]|uniref:Peptidase A2 domain-containing protein n=1 Tax=Dibothriocephalus latus TaxID=60516 RepID=A0A3P6RHJ5_DIBLA|nr:unnamed protein product [Dibothriocephalus latus]